MVSLTAQDGHNQYAGIKKVSLGPQQPLHRTVGGTTRPLSWKVESRLRIALGHCGRPDPSSTQHNGTDAVRRQGFQHHCVGRATDILIWQVVEDRRPWGRHAGMTQPGILMFLDRVWMTRKLAFSGFGRPSVLSWGIYVGLRFSVLPFFGKWAVHPFLSCFTHVVGT